MAAIVRERRSQPVWGTMGPSDVLCDIVGLALKETIPRKGSENGDVPRGAVCLEWFLTTMSVVLQAC